MESWLGPDLESGLRLAARHYSRRLRSASRPQPVLPLEGGIDGDPPLVELDLELDSGCREDLEAEARRTGSDLQGILVHAVFVYLADLDRSSTPSREDCSGRKRTRPPLGR